MKAVAFTPDSLSFLTAGAEVKLWDVRTGTLQRTFTPDGGPQPCAALAVSPDGKTLAAGGINSGSGFGGSAPIRLWDLRTGKLRGTWLHEGSDVASLAYSPDGKTLASSCQNGGVWLWDVATEKPRAKISLGGAIWAVAFSPDGKLLATGGTGNTVALWTTATGELVTTLTPHEHLVLGLAFSPDGNTLASGSYDQTFRLWDVRSRKQIKSLPFEGWVHSVAFSPDGKTLAIGIRDKTSESALRLLDLGGPGL